jgi:hypothetical protein
MNHKSRYRVLGLLAGVALLTVVSAACSSTPQSKGALIVNADTVSGGGCILLNQYKPGDTIVFRIKVYDPVTGEQMDDSSLKSVEVSFADQKLAAFYGGHPQGDTPTDFFWSYCWTVPDGYPTGTLNYKVTATDNEGRIGTYNEFNVKPSLVTILK